MTCTRTVQLHSQQVQNDCKLRQCPSQQTYDEQGNIKYCKIINIFPIDIFPIQTTWNIEELFSVALNLHQHITNLQSCIETQDENSNLIFFTFREYEWVIKEFPYSWAYYKTENKWWTKGKNILFLTGVTIRQSKMTQQMSINYHKIKFHFHTVSIFFFLPWLQFTWVWLKVYTVEMKLSRVNYFWQ